MKNTTRAIFFLTMILLLARNIYARDAGTASPTVANAPKSEQTNYFISWAIESPFFSVNVPLPSFALALSYNIGQFQFGVKVGSPLIWLLPYLVSFDYSKSTFSAYYYLEPLDIRYVFKQKFLLGNALGFREMGGSKSVRSPYIEAPSSSSDYDGFYSFRIKEWYTKPYIGYFVIGDSRHAYSVSAELGAIVVLNSNEQFQSGLSPSLGSIRKADLKSSGYEAYLADNLSQYRSDVKTQIYPLQYIYLSFRMIFNGL